MPGDLIHQVQFFIGNIDRVFHSFSFGDIPQDPVNPHRISRDIEPQGTFFLEPVDCPPFIHDPELGNELGTFFQFVGQRALHSPDISGMYENTE
jgi:hypothetical protein